MVVVFIYNVVTWQLGTSAGVVVDGGTEIKNSINLSFRSYRIPNSTATPYHAPNTGVTEQ